MEALSCIFELTKIKAFDIEARQAERFRDEVESRLGLNTEIVGSPEKAVRASDIVVTAGPILKNPDPVIEDDWFEKGVFASSVDFDSYWKHGPFQSVDKFYTDDLKQLLYYKEAGYLYGVPEKILDLGDLITGRSPGRESSDERIICTNLGIALDDIATALLVYKRAVEKGIGVELDL